MNTIKKLMFMSNNDKNTGMGILKFENKNNNVFCCLKTYQGNFNSNYILGIKLTDKIIKQNVILQNNCYNFVSTEIKNLDNVLGCVLIDIVDGEFKPIIWGNEKNTNYKANIINSLRQSLNNISNAKISSHTKIQNSWAAKSSEQNNTNKTLTTSNSITTPETQSIEENSQTSIQNNFNQEKISLLKLSKLTTQNNLQNTQNAYRPVKHDEQKIQLDTISQISLYEEKTTPQNIPEIAVASEQSILFEDDDESIEKLINEELNNEKNIPKPIDNNSHNFYNMIAEQLHELFDRYPPENNLNKLLENSQWVKIDTDIVNKHYVVGVIKKDNDIKYICYGVPGTYNQEPPIEMREYSQWLPTDISDPYNNGYWVMYQDADTGENIYIN